MISWNYRVIRINEEYLSIREVYYDDEGDTRWYSSEDLIIGDSLDELRSVLKQMESGIDKLVLTETDFNGGKVI